MCGGASYDCHVVACTGGTPDGMEIWERNFVVFLEAGKGHSTTTTLQSSHAHCTFPPLATQRSTGRSLNEVAVRKHAKADG